MSVNHQDFERKLRRLKRHACLSDGKNNNRQQYVHIMHYISERCWDRLDDFFFAIVESPETSAFGFCQSLWLHLMFGRSIELFLPPLLGEEEDQHAAIYDGCFLEAFICASINIHVAELGF